MAAEMEKEKERMASVMAKALLNDQTAVKLDNCTNAEQRQAGSVMTGKALAPP